eukprot:SAG31_NODE_1609_length_7753_cov_12.390253_5_plen_171_part_00
MRADLELLPPVFDIERDWGSMEAIDGAVSFEEFEAWWKRRVGVTSTDSHVMPELIVSSMSKEAALPSDHTVKQRWQFLSKNMVRVVTFSFLCPLLEKYGTFIARCNALIEKVSSCRQTCCSLGGSGAMTNDTTRTPRARSKPLSFLRAFAAPNRRSRQSGTCPRAYSCCM